MNELFGALKPLALLEAVAAMGNPTTLARALLQFTFIGARSRPEIAAGAVNSAINSFGS